MSTFTRFRFLTSMVLFSLLITSCSFPLPLLSDSQGASGGDEGMFEPIELSSDGDEAGGKGETNNNASSMADFRCPDSPEPYALWFDHTVEYATPGFGSWDISTSGTILLSVAEGLSEGTVQMPFQPGEVVVPGSVNAGFGRGDQTCSFEGEMEVIVNVDGNCDRGVVHLNIVENWGDVDTTMTCCSAGQDCDTFPFQWMLPVVQYEDLQFTPANGYRVNKPFAGGDGQLTWSLQLPVEPVPLTE